MAINYEKEFAALEDQLSREGAQPETDWIYSGQATIEIDGFEILIREAFAMRRKAQKGGPSLREQVQEAARQYHNKLHPPD